MQRFHSPMRRASFSLLSYLTRQKPRFSAPSSTGIYISNLSLLSASPTCHLKPCNNRSPVTITCRQFHVNPFRNNETPVEKKLREEEEDASLVLKRIKRNLQLLEDIEATDNIPNALSLLCFEEGLVPLAIGRVLDYKGDTPYDILSSASRALYALDRNVTTPCIYVAMALQLMGSASYYLKMFNNCLEYLKRANTILGRLEEDGFCFIENVRRVRHDVQLGLANVKTAMGRREEALCNLKKCLEIKETMLEENGKQLGVANRDLAEAYAAVLNFKEALPYALKALEIHTTGLGPNSVEVAHDRRVLGEIHTGLEDPKKALLNTSEQNQSSQNVLKKWGLNSDHLLRVEIDSADKHIALGRYQEAINTLKIVVHQTAKNSETRALVFITMGKALCYQEKFVSCKGCLSIAYEILKKKEKDSPVEVAEAYWKMLLQYECMHESKTAIWLLESLGLVLVQMGDAEAAIRSLAIIGERFEEKFGPMHVGNGYILKCIGVTLLKMNDLESSLSAFEEAKDIVEASLGPRHADSIDACQSVAMVHGCMKSYTLATALQERVVNALEGQEQPAIYDTVEKARELLEKFRTKASESSCDSIDHDPLAGAVENESPPL